MSVGMYQINRSRVMMQAQADSNDAEVIEVDAVDTDQASKEEETTTEPKTEEDADEPSVTKGPEDNEQDMVPSDMESNDNYNLYYFDAFGRAEPIRLLLSHAGVQFTDTRYERKEWKDNKKSMPGMKLPVLELGDGTKIGQSISILRFLGK